MKKTISLILCLSTILSSVAFSLPAVAADIDFDVESSTDYATPEEVALEDSALAEDVVYATFPVSYDFDTTTPTDLVTGNATKVTYAVEADSTGNKELKVTAAKPIATSRSYVQFALANTVALGSYKLSFDVRSEDAAQHTYYVYYQDSTMATAEKMIEKAVTGSGEVEVTLNTSADVENFSFRIGINRETNGATSVFYIDNVSLVSVPTQGKMTFDANGGKGTQEPQMVSSGDIFTLPTAAETTVTREYHDFVGWARTADGEPITTYEVKRADMQGADLHVTFYAIWVRRTFDVTIDFDGGSVEAATKYTANEGESCTVKLPSASSVRKNGYLLSHYETADGTRYNAGRTVDFTEAAALTAKYTDISTMEIVNPVKSSSYNGGGSTDVDPLHPGIFYTFDKALDASSVSVEALNMEGNYTVSYDEATMTLAVYPNGRNVRPGVSFDLPGAQTSIMTADGKGLVKLPAYSIKLASTYLNEYENLITGGDVEGGYIPFYTPGTNAETVVMEEEDGNHFIRVLPLKEEEAWVHTQTNFVLENGATYKLFFKARSVGSANLCFNVSFSGNMAYCDEDIGEHANKWNHVWNLGTLAEWRSLDAEFIPNITGTAEQFMSVYSNPSNKKITSYDVDDFALYKKLTVSFSAGTQAVLKEGETNPGQLGYYPGLGESGIITLPDMPYESTDPDWTIDAAKPWMDNNGNTYAAGEEVDLAVIGKTVFSPNMTTDMQTYTVTFVGNEDAASLPNPVKVIAGRTLDLSKLEDVTSKVDYKRFNGWSLTGYEFSDVLEEKVITVNGNMTLKAVITPGYNFAIKSNNDGWINSNASIKEKMYEGKYLLVTATGTDAFIWANLPGKLPASKYKAIKVIFDAAYQPTEGANPYAKLNTWIEGFYFMHPGEGASGERYQGGSVIELTEDGHAIALFNMYNNKKWNGYINAFRFDLFNGPMTAPVRSIEFIEADEFDTKEVKLSGVSTPSEGMAAMTDVSKITEASGNATVSSLSWSPALVNGRFDEKTVYTATLSFTPAAQTGKIFAAGTTVTLDGIKADETIVNDDASITASFTFPATGAFVPFDMEIEGSDVLTVADRSVQYKIKVTSDEKVPDTTVTWSVNNTEAATISASGRLTPHQNCEELVIKAASNYNPFYSVTKTIRITNQAERGMVKYHTVDAANVTGMPADITNAYGKTALSSATPVRDGYVFLGWATSDETINTVEAVQVGEGKTVDVYAVWGTGVVQKYNGTGKGYTEVGNHAADYRIHITNINLDPKLYSTVLVTASSTTNFTTRIYYKTEYVDENGITQQIGYDKVPGATGAVNSYAQAEGFAMSVNSTCTSLDSFQTAVFDFSNHQGTHRGGWPNANKIVSIYVDPCRTTNQPFRIASVIVLGPANITFDANTSDAVTGMPMAINAVMGSTLSISEKPVREGYTFVGWSKDPTDRSNVKTSFGISGDTTFYAVWDKSINVEDAEEGAVEIGEISTDNTAVLVQGKEGVKYTLEFVDASGEPVSIEATANANGYAVFDLTEVARPITEATLASSDDNAPTSVTLTDYDNANKTANYVKQPTPGSSSNSSAGGIGTKYNYNSSVTEVKNNGEQYTITGKEDGGKSVLNETKSDDTILFNFNEEYESGFFATERQLSLVGIKDSVASYRSLGLKEGSNDSPALFTTTLGLDATSHKYIVVKVKESGLSNKNLRIYFKTPGTKFSQANSIVQNMTEEYSMLVYDMSTLADWKGTIDQLFFSLEGNVKGTVDIDWIMFTNTVPESMNDVTGGAKVAFPIVNKGDMPFTDVKSDDWFFSEVANAYKLGFVEGDTATTFNPEGNVTIAEAITLAVRLNYIYNSKELPKAAATDDWFTPFVNAAVKAGIIKNNQFTDYNVPAPRKQVAAIMVKALPNEFYTKINMFTEVPDLEKKDATYSAVLKLYNAGIVAGVDGAYNFLPESPITRSEVAAIVNRLSDAGNRKRIVTQAEIESKKKKVYADDLVSAGSLGNCESTKFTMKDGVAWGKAKTADPIVYFKDCIGEMNGKEISKITITVKDFGTAYDPMIFFTTPTGGWAEARKIIGKKGEAKDGLMEITFDTKSNGEFANTISNIRFDPHGATGGEFGIYSIVVE